MWPFLLPNSLLWGACAPRIRQRRPTTHSIWSPRDQPRPRRSSARSAVAAEDGGLRPRHASSASRCVRRARARCCARGARHPSHAQRSSLSARRQRRQVELRGARQLALVCSSSRARIPQHAMRPRGGLSPTTPTLSPPGGLSPARRARRARSRCAPPARPPPLVRRAASRKAPSSPLPTHLTLAPTFPLAGLLQLPDPVGGGDMAVDMAQLS